MNPSKKKLIYILSFTFFIMHSCTSKQKAASNSGIVDASQITEDLKAGKNIYLENKTVNGDLDFTDTGVRVKEGAGLWRSYITSGLTFSNCVFTGKVIAYKSEKEELILCDFGRNVSFSECQFKEVVSFRESTVRGNCAFSKCFFIQKTSFEGMRFFGEVSFNGANFAEELRFQNSIFYNRSNFMDAVFGKITYFQGSMFINDVQMSTTRWYKYADFSICTFQNGCFFNYAQFDERSVFNNCNFRGRAEFLKAKFTGNSEFKNCLFYGQVKMFEAEVATSINFTGSTFLLSRPEEKSFYKTGNASILFDNPASEKQ